VPVCVCLSKSCSYCSALSISRDYRSLLFTLSQQKTKGFSDQQVLELAKLDRRHLCLPANLSHPATLQRLIETAHSTGIKHVLIFVETDYFHRFLNSIGLVEEEGRLFDVADPSSPLFLFNINATQPNYFIDNSSGYLKVFGDHLRRHVHIFTEPIYKGQERTHSMSLSRLCKGYACI
ncbi:hypothetical protein PFISCL1PPCAC_3115, partial [Pristionchus fissidentatus]